jgi:hypothetical protein
VCVSGRHRSMNAVISGASKLNRVNCSARGTLARSLSLLTDKRRIPLRSASVRTPHIFHHGIPKVLVNPRSKGITSVRSTYTH